MDPRDWSVKFSEIGSSRFWRPLRSEFTHFGRSIRSRELRSSETIFRVLDSPTVLSQVIPVSVYYSQLETIDRLRTPRPSGIALAVRPLDARTYGAGHPLQ